MKKTSLLLCLVLAAACTNVNKPLTDDDKNRIIGEAKEFISMIIQTCEKPAPEMLKSLYLNSPDFVSMVGGVYADYDQTLVGLDGYFANVSSQKATIRNEKYIVLDGTTVLYTANSSWEAKLKNDSTIVMDPTGMQFILKKVDNDWKVLSWTEEVIMKQ
jgi:hypothetical protein